MTTRPTESTLLSEDSGTAPASIDDYHLLAVMTACPEVPIDQISRRLGFNPDHAVQLLTSRSGALSLPGLGYTPSPVSRKSLVST